MTDLSLYARLVQLQKETTGASFTLGYSTRSECHCVRFTNKAKQFESPYLEGALEDAIAWLMSSRKEMATAVSYTLYK